MIYVSLVLTYWNSQYGCDLIMTFGDSAHSSFLPLIQHGQFDKLRPSKAPTSVDTSVRPFIRVLLLLPKCWQMICTYSTCVSPGLGDFCATIAFAGTVLGMYSVKYSRLFWRWLKGTFDHVTQILTVEQEIRLDVPSVYRSMWSKIFFSNWV